VQCEAMKNSIAGSFNLIRILEYRLPIIDPTNVLRVA
jgi:hypothetical protein